MPMSFVAKIETETAASAALLPQVSRRGRPSAVRIVEIDSAIKQGARQQFLDTGYELTTMDNIAAAAGVSKGTLYARYDSKEALFRVIITDLLERLSLRAGAEDHLLPANLADRLAHHARVLISVFGWNEYIVASRLMLGASQSLPDMKLNWQMLGKWEYVKFLAKDMMDCADVKEAKNVDWTFLANQFLHSISGWYLGEASTRDVSAQEATDFCDKVIQSILLMVDAKCRAH
jgi:TetR/AcrR family transcriptional regulator, mexJK operon transcriptional repressor